MRGRLPTRDRLESKRPFRRRESQGDRQDGHGRWPVESIVWDEARQFCDRLGTQPGENASRRRYALPTEAQWEYACRAGSTGPWYFVDEHKSDFAAELNKLEDYSWNNPNAPTMLHAVGQKRPNPWGLHDLCGNVWEWCLDDDSFGYYRSSPINDPLAPETEGGFRIARGGAFSTPVAMCRSAFRGNGSATGRFDSFGFRVVCEIPLKPGS